jgi:hypothetical protein
MIFPCWLTHQQSISELDFRGRLVLEAFGFPSLPGWDVASLVRGCTMMNGTILLQIIAFSIALRARKFNIQFAFFQMRQVFCLAESAIG